MLYAAQVLTSSLMMDDRRMNKAHFARVRVLDMYIT